VVAAVAALVLVAAAPAAAVSHGTAPGAPGNAPDFAPANKDGFGTATSQSSKVWHTLQNGELTEVYYPDLGTPAVRDLQFIVSDGKTFAERETDATDHVTQLADPKSLTYRQVNTAKSGLYRITKTYVEDPARNTLLVDVTFESLTKRKLALYVLYDPSLFNDGADDSGTTSRATLLASDAHSASALQASPSFARTSNGYLGTSDGWTDLRNDYRMDWNYDAAPNGNLVQTADTGLTGRNNSQHLTLALGFGGSTADASAAASASLAGGFAAAASAYAGGWHDYLAGLSPEPAGAAPYGPTYDVSVMALAAHEDKTYRGGFIASPTMPWAWGTNPTLEHPSGAYHLVWARDLYEIATALLAAGDGAAANRALDYLFHRQQKPDGSFPQNSTVDGTPHWTNLQLDEVADPIILASQLGRTGADDWAHVKRAADFIVSYPNAPFTPQERWENQSGYSPATIAAEIAGLICAADIARRNGDDASATRYEQTADAWQQQVDGWTATQTGPYSPTPYYLRLTKDGNPNADTPYDIGDSGPTGVDQRKVVDPSFLELVRLGVKSAKDPVVKNSIAVVDKVLSSGRSDGSVFWHRFTFDGYGETKDGHPWDIGFPTNPTEDWSNNTTIGRNWPIFGGERGEYELAAGDASSAQARLGQMAHAANDGYLLPEQVWAPDFPPAGQPGFPVGEGTFSATPLAWSHAQFVRLAWSLQKGYPVEQPCVVASRYVSPSPSQCGS
ncbi:MAG TPA: glycoside hydrolase family 15 protein, partial [Solirubrobacteraceae bacterium]|nr:glycoside hydrolase family 15 protein [Solirubrobacteraceae bacterium]